MEGLIAEFGSQLSQSYPDEHRLLRGFSSLIKFGLHMVESRSAAELDGVSYLITFLGFGLGYVHVGEDSSSSVPPIAQCLNW